MHVDTDIFRAQGEGILPCQVSTSLVVLCALLYRGGSGSRCQAGLTSDPPRVGGISPGHIRNAAA